MIKKSLKKLVGLKKEEFDHFVNNGQIILQPARLIPTHKTGDELALTSIFLSTVKLVKEYRDSIFKEIRLGRSGKVYYYTEASFPDINKCRIDGLVIIVIKGKIVDAAFFEMKNKANKIDKAQIEGYLQISKQLKVNKLVTVSNEFVSDPSHSPIKVKVPKSISLLHFSWTYLVTKGLLLLYKNDHNIADEDQVQIMSEALHYFENSASGISGYTQMKPGWKELAENIRARKTLKVTDAYIEDAVLSWYEEEKDIALLMSRNLGVLVRTSNKKIDSLKRDIKRLISEYRIIGNLHIRDAVSDIQVVSDFERRTVSMSIRVTPPLNTGHKARISWIGRQLENCKKKAPELFKKIEKDIWIEAEVKFARTNIKVRLTELSKLIDLTSGKEIQGFKIVFLQGFGAGFSSVKKFIVLIENMILDFYDVYVQHVSTWKRPTPKLIKDID